MLEKPALTSSMDQLKAGLVALQTQCSVIGNTTSPPLPMIPFFL